MSRTCVATLVLLVMGTVSCEAELIKARSPESGSWGLLNGELEWKIEPIYSYLSDFNDGVAVGERTRTNYDIIDVHGEVIGSFRANATRTPGDGLIPTLSDEDIWSYRDYSGQVVLTGYETATEFSDGLAYVIESGAGRFIDTTGEAVVSADYSQALPLGDGLYAVRVIGSTLSESLNWVLIDVNGNRLATQEFSLLLPFSEGLAAAALSRTGIGLPTEYGYVDKSGAFVIDPQYHSAQRMSNGKAIVQYKPLSFPPTGQNSMLIDRSGRVVTVFPPDWGIVSNFYNDYAVFWVEAEENEFYHGILDSNGEIVVEPAFRDSRTEWEFYSNGYFQLIDRDSGRSILFDTETGEAHSFP